MTKETCRYCGGNCPNEPENSEYLCDSYAGDIDHLYEGERLMKEFKWIECVKEGNS